MDQKAFGILFGVILVIGVIVLTISRMNGGGNLAASPSPSPSIDPLFQNGNKQVVSTPTPAPRQAKQYPKFPGALAADKLTNKTAIITTSKGVIKFEVYPEATKAASNFVFLAGDKFYDGLIFHRVEDWVVQGGDPTGTGRGGPGYTFEDEPVTRKYEKGTVAMANAGPNTNGSQFFILKTDYPLPPKYTIFGKVTEGMDIVEKLQVGDVMQTVQIVNSTSAN